MRKAFTRWPHGCAIIAQGFSSCHARPLRRRTETRARFVGFERTPSSMNQASGPTRRIRMPPSCPPDFDPLAPDDNPFPGPTLSDHTPVVQRRVPAAPGRHRRRYRTIGTWTCRDRRAALPTAEPTARPGHRVSMDGSHRCRRSRSESHPQRAAPPFAQRIPRPPERAAGGPAVTRADRRRRLDHGGTCPGGARPLRRVGRATVEWHGCLPRS